MILIKRRSGTVLDFFYSGYNLYFDLHLVFILLFLLFSFPSFFAAFLHFVPAATKSTCTANLHLWK